MFLNLRILLTFTPVIVALLLVLPQSCKIVTASKSFRESNLSQSQSANFSDYASTLLKYRSLCPDLVAHQEMQMWLNKRLEFYLNYGQALQQKTSSNIKEYRKRANEYDAQLLAMATNPKIKLNSDDWFLTKLADTDRGVVVDTFEPVLLMLVNDGQLESKIDRNLEWYDMLLAAIVAHSKHRQGLFEEYFVVKKIDEINTVLSLVQNPEPNGSESSPPGLSGIEAIAAEWLRLSSSKERHPYSAAMPFLSRNKTLKVTVKNQTEFLTFNPEFFLTLDKTRGLELSRRPKNRPGNNQPVYGNENTNDQDKLLPEKKAPANKIPDTLDRPDSPEGLYKSPSEGSVSALNKDIKEGDVKIVFSQVSDSNARPRQNPMKVMSEALEVVKSLGEVTIRKAEDGHRKNIEIYIADAIKFVMENFIMKDEQGREGYLEFEGAEPKIASENEFVKRFYNLTMDSKFTHPDPNAPNAVLVMPRSAQRRSLSGVTDNPVFRLTS